MKNLAAASLLLFTACADNNDGLFHVTGHVDANAGTHIIAATADGQSVVRKFATDGSFELPLAPKHAWVVSIVDANRTGSAMLVATLQSGLLDTLAPMSNGMLDLGKVDVALGVATPAASYDTIINELGLDRATAARIGGEDDYATHLATPDVDGNGVIDALEPGHDYTLDIRNDIHLVGGNGEVTVTEMLQATPPVYGYAYDGTGIRVQMPAGYSMDSMDVASLTFQDPFYGTYLGANTPMVPAGEPIGQPELLTGALDSHPLAAVYARPQNDIPMGTYKFNTRETKLRFDGVRTASSEELATGEGVIVPFLRIVPTDAGCVTDCTISAIEYRWMQRTEGQWQPAPAAELALMPAGRIDVTRMQSNGKLQDLHLTLPTNASGSLDWVSSASYDGMFQSDLYYVTSTQICYVGASFQDFVGMRLTSGATSIGGGCPQ